MLPFYNWTVFTGFGAGTQNDSFPIAQKSRIKCVQIHWGYVNTDAFTGDVGLIGIRVGQAYTSGLGTDSTNTLAIVPLAVGSSAIATETIAWTETKIIPCDFPVMPQTKIFISFVSNQLVLTTKVCIGVVILPDQ